MKKWIPWVLSAAIVAVLLLTTDLEAVGAALEKADWGLLLGVMALVTVVSYVVDALTLVALFRRFVARVTVAETLAIKGVSYFLNAINYSLAAGGMAYLLHRRHGKPFLETFSALLWFFFVDIVALTVMLTGGFVFGRELMSDSTFIERLPVLIAILWGVVIGSLVYWNGRFDFIAFGFFRKWRIFHTFQEAKLVDYPRMVAIRVCFILVYVTMHWLLLPAFDVHISFGNLLMYSPLITFVQVIPATVSGLGAVQGVMVGLFSGHVIGAGDPKAVIVAYSTVIGPLMMLYRLLIGYGFMASVSKDLVVTKREVVAAREAADQA